MKKYNVLYIHSHDTGRYIQPYGHAIHTPNLQKLAEEGVLFRKAFCANPTCSPSRASLLTGQYPHSNGMYGLAHRGECFKLNDYKHHILHTLKKEGYTTALAGVQHIAHWTEKEIIGYDQLLDNEPTSEDSAINFLDTIGKKPFFLSVGFSQTHRVFPKQTPNENPNYTLPPAPLPDTPETRQDMARFKESARQLDDKMGTIFAALKKNKLDKNTIIICTTDHGIAFPGMKCNLTDHGIGVMLIMKGPAGFSGGKVVDSMISQIDIFPTICDVLDIKAPNWLQGKSFMSIIRNEADSVNNEIFAEVNFHASREPKRCVRTERWKYIRFYDDLNHPVLANCDDSISKDVWLSNGWNQLRPAKERLYDLNFDPNEACNLADNPDYQGIVSEMRMRLENWQKKTKDPLLSGTLANPPTARLNPQNGISPGTM